MAGTEARPTDFSSFRVSRGLMNYCLGTRKKSGEGRGGLSLDLTRAFRLTG